jgi:PPOX class probable F420-dependent enzyme
MRRRVSEARVGRLATTTADGRPHVVPCCFALSGSSLYTAIDTKPKSSGPLRRVRNLKRNPAAALIVDHYEEEWANLWWIRIDGIGRIPVSGAERDAALELLTGKYAQYERDPPPGPVIAIAIFGPGERGPNAAVEYTALGQCMRHRQ